MVQNFTIMLDGIPYDHKNFAMFHGNLRNKLKLVVYKRQAVEMVQVLCL